MRRVNRKEKMVDGRSRRTSVLAVPVVAFILLALLAGGLFIGAPAAANGVVPEPIGPVYPPPGGVDIALAGQMSLGSGMVVTFANPDLARFEHLYWGPMDETGVELALDGTVDADGETLTFSASESDLESGVAVWLGEAELTYLTSDWQTVAISTRLTMTSSDADGLLPMTAGVNVGLEESGAVLDVPGDYQISLLMSIYFDGAWQPASAVFNDLQTPEGHQVIANLYDAFYYTEAPITDLTADNSGPTALGEETTLTATVSGGTGISYTWDLGDSTSATTAVVLHTYPAVGVYTATVTASNTTGTSNAATIVVVEEPISGLVAVATSPVRTDESAYLTATVSSGSNVSYTWAFGDGDSGSGSAAQHLYSTAGSYTATVTATNALGSAAAQTLIVAEDPILDLTALSNSPVRIGKTAFLSATVSSGTNVTYTWAFGDAASGTGASVSHEYGAIGVYTATVSAENAVSNATATTVVIVEPYRVYLPIVFAEGFSEIPIPIPTPIPI
jgi:PKD repeat protein